MIENSNKLGSVVADFVSALGLNETWLQQALMLSIAPDFSALSGTKIGFLASIDSRAPETRQYAAHIRTSEAATELSTILGEGGGVECDIADCLREVVSLSRVQLPWHVVIGARVGSPNVGARLYVGSMQPEESDRIVEVLKNTKMWFTPPRDETLELIDRIRATSSLIAVSRRVGAPHGHLLYFAPNTPLTENLIAYVTAPLSSRSRRDLIEFSQQYTCGVSLSPMLYGWGVEIDHDGEFQSLKLEVSKYLHSFANLPAESGFFEAAARLRSISAQFDLSAVPRTISCRVGGHEASYSIYFAFSSNAPESQQSSVSDHAPRAITPTTQSSWLADEIKSVVTRATKRLVAKQRHDGAWLDFNMPIGFADAWVTAHVGLCLIKVQSVFPTDRVGTALCAARAFVLARWRDGWAYNSKSPVDADSTAHGMIFLESMGCASPSHAPEILLHFQQPDGGFATFKHPQGDEELHSWSISHPDVTALAVRALQPHLGEKNVAAAVAQAVKYMHVVGAEIGWQSFWWNLNWYTLANWLETIIRFGGHWPQVSIPTHLRQEAVGKMPLDCALQLHAATLLREVYVADELAEKLVSLIDESDSWPVNNVLRLPEPDELSPWSASYNGPLLPDSRAVYSAATICEALAAYYESKI